MPCVPVCASVQCRMHALQAVGLSFIKALHKTKQRPHQLMPAFLFNCFPTRTPFFESGVNAYAFIHFIFGCRIAFLQRCIFPFQFSTWKFMLVRGEIPWKILSGVIYDMIKAGKQCSYLTAPPLRPSTPSLHFSTCLPLFLSMRLKECQLYEMNPLCFFCFATCFKTCG